MENEKFQDLMLDQFAKLFNEFKDVKNEFKDVKNEFKDVKNEFKDVKSELADVKEKLEVHDKRFDRLDEQITKLGAFDQSDIEKVARQVEQLVVGQEFFRTETKNTLERMQNDMNYLVRKTTTHDDDIIQLKKAK